MSGVVRVRAHAKVNLALRVGAPRPDGYHPLTSVFEAIDIPEDVTAELTPGRPFITCAVAEDSPRGAGLDVGPDNLLVRAAQAVADEAALPENGGRDVLHEAGGVHLIVSKSVPVAGGLAGGSADAAAALVACNELWGTGLSQETLHELARGLGADVPFALEGGIGLGTDRGDRIDPVQYPEGTRHHWVLAMSHQGLSTPVVFRHFDATVAAPAQPPGADELVAVLGGRADAGVRAGEDGSDGVDGADGAEGAEGASDAEGAAGQQVAAALDLAPLLVNDLTETALDLRPDLGDVFAAFERAGAVAVMLCGSGPTIAALCMDEEHARSVAEVVRAAEVAAEVLTAAGPVPGARLVDADGAGGADGGSGAALERRGLDA